MKSVTWLAFNTFFLLINKVTPDCEKPHIIVIIADDVGWNDFGFHGSSQIPTPNIDALAYNGVVLNRFYTQQLCTPSRAAFLTGNYPIRSGMQGIPISGGENIFLPNNMLTLPESLKRFNYSTHLVGKWHLGASSKNHTPTARGFDTHFGYWNGFIGYFNHVLEERFNSTTNFSGFDLHYGLKPQWQYQGQYFTDLLTKKSLEVVENHNQSQPLFLAVSHLAAHTGDKGIELGVPNVTKAEDRYSYIRQPERRRTADIINIMDDSIGQLIKKLSDKNMLECSIIIFFSDNGGQTIGDYQNFASNWPLRGLKFTLNEGGVRGTCAVYSPLLEKQGYINNELIHISDLMPTLYHLAGGNVSDLGNIDGVNQWNVISRNEPTSRKDILLNINELENQSGIIGYNGRYKLLNGTYRGLYDQYYGDSGRDPKIPPYNTEQIINSPTNKAIQKLRITKTLTKETIETRRKQLDVSDCRDSSFKPFITCQNFCLFDLKNDLCETENIINDRNTGQIVEDLKKQLEKYWHELVPQPHRGSDPRSDPAFCNRTWFPWLDGDNSCILC